VLALGHDHLLERVPAVVHAAEQGANDGVGQ
jgi:hypothetical protein